MAPITIEWRMPIAEFKSAEVAKRIWSKPYSPLEYSPLKFYLRVFPHGDAEQTKDYITYYLYCLPPNGVTIEVEYNLYILNERGDQIAYSPWTGEFGSKHQTWGKRKFVRRPDTAYLCDDDFITFGCQLTVLNFDRKILFSSSECKTPMLRDTDRYSLTETITQSFPPEEDRETIDGSNSVDSEESFASKYGDKIASLFKNMDLTDVNLHVGDEVIKAHKLILFLNSPCLAAMVKLAETEFDTTSIDIEDFAPQAVRLALEFMYTETISNFENLAAAEIVELDRFATAFEFADLKSFIESKIDRLIDISNACDFANLSVSFGQEAIRSVALDFITDNLRAIKLNDTFEKLSDKNAKDILRKLDC